MKQFCAILISLLLPLAAHCADQEQLLGVLQSPEASLHEKDAACARLKLIGTVQSVPALAALLTNDDLSHSARYALESMPFPEAGRALLTALPATSGSNEVGIINSLAMRHDADAIPHLVKLLKDSDPLVSTAAAEGLGRIGGPKAIKALTGALPQPAAIDGLLMCANTLLTEGKAAPALKIFRHLYEREKPDAIRLAAFRGVILASGDKGAAMLASAISGSDAATQGAALQLAGQIKGAAVTKALADVLPSASVPVQIALLQCLAQRGDVSALPAVAALANSADANVRLAAVTALGDLGDGSVALLLARQAATGQGPERDAARRSLTDLRHGTVTPALVEPLATASPEVSLELIRALGDRGDSSAAPALLQLVTGPGDSLRLASLQALALLAGPTESAELVRLAVQTTNDEVRSETADALASICQRGQWDGKPVLEAVLHAAVEARLALLPVCASLVEAPARDTLRAALADSDPRVQEAAIRALCNTRDGQLLPDLTQVACGDGEKKLKVLAVRGCVRLATQEEDVKLSTDAKLDVLQKILATPLDAPEKRLILSGLETIPDPRALALATPLLDDPSVQPEAADAVIKISASISAAQPDEASAALKKVLALSLNESTRKSAQKAFKKIP